jgi:type IV pilus assembly protein PilW
MKTSPFPRVGRGFSLAELLVAMAISVTLMAALASIFATSVRTREKVDLEGQKIETARYSLDTLSEDIRLAGYFGILAPSLGPPLAALVNGAVPANWFWVDPCSTANGDLPGWSGAAAQDATSTSTGIEVPMAIFGYDMHGAGVGADLPPAALLACIGAYQSTPTVAYRTGTPVAGPPASGGAYKRGTDVLVVRRTSTVAVTPGAAGWLSGDPYLQTSTCPEGSVDAVAKFPPRYIARATTTSGDFNMNMLGCTPTVPGANASVRKLITRIYFIAQCDDCFNDLDNNTATMGDGIPTLKMVELGVIPTSGTPTTLRMVENVRTIAPGVEDMHFEYGIDSTDDGSIDTWVTSNNNPRQDSLASGNATGVLVNGMRCHNPKVGPPETTACDVSAENRWEDVMAVNLFLVTRDLKTTSGTATTKTFTMGSRTVTTPADGYRRRMTSSTIKLVNLSARREVP